MNVEQLGNFVPDGRMVRVMFTGRSDGLEHEAVGRVGVKKYLKGIGYPFDPYEKNLLPIFSYKRDSRGRFLPKIEGMKDSSGYRLIPAENVISIKSAGITYGVIE